MSMMDLGAALGAAPPGPAGPPPADAGAPPEQAGSAEDFTSSLDALDAAEEALHAFIRLDPDEADRSVAAQCLQNVIKLKAANQQSQQSGDMKSFQRALVGGGGPPGGPVG